MSQQNVDEYLRLLNEILVGDKTRGQVEALLLYMRMQADEMTLFELAIATTFADRRVKASEIDFQP